MDKQIEYSFLGLLEEKLPSLDKGLIDEILVDYIVSFIRDTCIEAEDSLFDITDFKEMLEAYFPDASVLDETDIRELIMKTCANVRIIKQSSCANEASAFEKPVLPTSVKVKKLSESSNGESSSSRVSESSDMGTLDLGRNNQELQTLMEMFPDVCRLELSHCLSLSNGDIEGAVQLVLYREESGERYIAEQCQGGRKPTKSESELDPEALKKLIINKYSFVDEEDEKREHRPAPIKAEPKKLIRYLDNKVVSVKGERFTQLKDPREESEEMKKTYVSLKPAKKYHFH